MKPVWAVLVAVTLVASYGVGHLRRDSVAMDLSSVESFRQSMVENNALIRSLRFNGFLETLNAENFEEAFVVVEANYNWLSTEEVRALFLAWARFDPEGSLEWALSQPLRNQLRAASAAMSAWAFYDPDQARKALRKTRKREDAHRLKTLEQKHAFGWIRGGNRDRVAAYLVKQPPSNFRQKASSVLASELMRDDPESLIRWVDGISLLTKANYKNDAFKKAANMLAQADPIRAAQWVESHLDKSYSKRSAILVAKRWVDREDPEAAIGWLLGIPADQIEPDAVAGTIEQWKKLDSEAAKKWLRASTPDQALDLAVSAMARNDAEADPISALDWADQVHDPEQRRRLIVRTCQYWLRIEPEAADRWIEKSGLAEDVRAEIRQPPTAPSRRRGNRQQSLHESGLETIHGSDRVKEA